MDVADVADVAHTVRHMAKLPLEANAQFATVPATAMQYVGPRPGAAGRGPTIVNASTYTNGI